MAAQTVIRRLSRRYDDLIMHQLINVPSLSEEALKDPLKMLKQWSR